MHIPGALMALAASQLASAPVGEAFSATASPSPDLMSRASPPININVRSPRRSGRPSTASFGSLRDLIDESAGGTEGGDDDAVADFNNRLVNFSRSKFADTKFRSRSVYGTGTDGDDERGQRRDRLSPFSFAANAPQSGSGMSLDEEGPAASAKEDKRKAMREAVMASAAAAAGGEDADVASDVDESGSKYGDETMVSDNHGGSVGTYYSNRKYPAPEKKYRPEADRQDQLGLHGDRLSTFSFGSKKPEARSRSQPRPEDALDGDVSADEEKVEADRTTVPESREDLDASFGVDNMHGNINIATSRNPAAENRPDLFTASEGEDNHGDRLSTFSMSRNEDKGGAPLGPAPPSTSGGSGGAPLSDVDNHGDRLGTFSFASTDLQSGSTTARGTSAASPLPDTGDSNVKPPPPSTAQSARSTPSADKPDYSLNNEASYEVYSPPDKGSLSSLASSVSIKTRNDRINEIKEQTDPKRLHPDGMNVPRLNSKGDVMSFSSASGRPNFFQRIEQTAQDENEGSGAEGKGDSAKEKNTDGMINGAESDGMGDSPEGESKSSSNDGRKGVSSAGGDCFIGFDLGTSGARMSIVEATPSGGYNEVFTAALTWDDKMQYDDAKGWKDAIDALLSRAQGTEVMSRVKSICVSGTSATCLLVNKHSLDVSRRARMYNYDIKSGDESPVDCVMELIDRYVPEKHTARATTGSLAKLMLWNAEQPLNDEALCHQSDYVSMSLIHEGREDEEKCTVTSDWHNCLKLGYDVRQRAFPVWMHDLLKEGANIPNPESVLPSKVISPGEPFGVISPTVASKYGLSSNVVLVGGTTDSNAAFFAAAGATPDYGTAVTSLGSTLAIKQLSKTFVEDASRGVYSHRFPRFAGKEGGDEDDAWLIGGASNVGCAVLRQEGFSNDELATLSAEIDPNVDSPLSYYPLMKKGERFPVADSEKEPVLEPKPDSRKEYLHGLLQGIGDVERDGFTVLGELGASPSRPTVVLSCGGGSKNDVWISMRQRRLKDICDEGQRVEVKRAENTEASFGAALLAAAHVSVVG